MLAIVTLRQDLAGGAGTDNATLILSGRSLVAVHATFLLGPAFCAAIVRPDASLFARERREAGVDELGVRVGERAAPRSEPPGA